MSYAQGTKVAPEKSRAEIEKLLTKQKVSQVGVNMDLANGRAIVLFTMPGAVVTPAAQWPKVVAEVRSPPRVVSFAVKMPKREDFNKSRNGYLPTADKVDSLWEQAIRARWRNLLMVLKGKFAAIESGVETFEEAFLCHLQVPSGGTVGEHVMPRYQQAIANPGAPLLGSGQ